MELIDRELMKVANSFIRKVEKINIVIISAYGLAIIISLLTTPFNDRFIYLSFALLVSISIISVINHLLKHEPIVHRSPLYYYAFLVFSTITVYIDGGYSSKLFPAIFILPILYTSINFSRKGSTGIAIFSVIVVWLTILQDPYLVKLDQTIIISILLLVIPQTIGFLVKEYVSNMKRLIKGNRIHIDGK